MDADASSRLVRRPVLYWNEGSWVVVGLGTLPENGLVLGLRTVLKPGDDMDPPNGP